MSCPGPGFVAARTCRARAFPGRSAAGRRRLDVGHFVTDLPALLHGQGQRHDDGARRLSDNTLVKLFRLLRLARRLLDLEAGAVGSGT